jgi:hypothetical protein
VFFLAGLLLAGAAMAGAALAGPGAASGATPGIRTLVGGGHPGTLLSPGGITLDSAGDLFIADTDHCRVLLVPDHAGSLYGRRVVAGHPYTVAGGTCGGPKSLGYPTGVAVDRQGDLFIAEATGERVLMVAPGGNGNPHRPVVVAGTGTAGVNGDGLLATRSQLDEPTGVAVDAGGDLFIADTANCLVRIDPATSGVRYGQPMLAGHLYDLVGDGTCGSADGSPARMSQIWDPVAVAVDQAGDIFIADKGDQTVVEVPDRSGEYYGTAIGGGDAQVVIGVVGDGNTPYLEDGLSATSVVAEMNDPEGLAVSPSGTIFVTDGTMHCIRVVPATTSDVFGRTMDGGDLYTLAGALPVTNALGLGDGNRWVLTQLGDPIGIALTASGSVVFSDQSTGVVREIG